MYPHLEQLPQADLVAHAMVLSSKLPDWSGTKSVPQTPQVIGPAASTVGETRIRRPHSHTHAGGLGFFVRPASVISAERCSRSAAPSSAIVAA
jgi:hypothetical protein